MYELLYIVPAIYAEDELKNVIAKIEALLKEEGAEVVKSEVAGKLKFAYTIKRHAQGYYVLAYFTATGELLKKIERALHLEKNILRFMITVAAKKSAAGGNIKEYVEIEPSERRFVPKQQSPIVRDKDKIKLEDIDKKLDVLLEKDIV